ncbi:MAG: GAF domain-containing sensor histidine kinase [Anaerolineales bacterium]|nr:GAF domain-containing sensor histidine kinase [Anaerolineales bacterium]
MVLLTREQLEDRLAALHRASLELVSDLSSETVLERIVQLAREQAGARYAALGVMDEHGDLDQFIPVGMSAEKIAQMPHPPLGRGLLGAIRKDRRTIRLPDISADPRSVGFPPNHPPMRSFLSVPILLGEHLLGQIYLTDKLNYYEFTEQDEIVLETLAAYAAVAINNSRLYGELVNRDHELCQRNEDLKLLNDVAAALTSSLEVDEILDKTLNLVMEYLDVEGGEIFLREDGEQELRLALHRGDFKDAFSHLDRFRFGEGFIGMVAATGKPLVSNNLRQDMRYLRPAVFEAGFQCIACIPLTAGGKVVGVMSAATRRSRELDERELHMLIAIGTWAGITIENARLSRQSRRLAILEERERIGMDLHDGIIQSIYGVGLALDYARMALAEDPEQSHSKIEQSIDSLNAIIRDIRAYILDLRPRQFHGEDLKQSLQRLVDEFQANSHTRATLVGPENGLVDFPAANATALFHICQESLANIAKHSRAQHAEIHLWIARERVLLEISDDGQGFDLRKMSVTLGHGLSNMHVRARKVGGDVEITSYPGEGTTVLAWVPRRASGTD